MLRADLGGTELVSALKEPAAAAENRCEGTESSYVRFSEPSVSIPIVKNTRAFPIAVISGSSFT